LDLAQQGEDGLESLHDAALRVGVRAGRLAGRRAEGGGLGSAAALRTLAGSLLGAANHPGVMLDGGGGGKHSQSASDVNKGSHGDFIVVGDDDVGTISEFLRLDWKSPCRVE